MLADGSRQQIRPCGRGCRCTSHLQPQSSDVDTVGRELDELDELTAPFFAAIVELNQAAEAYVFQNV